MQFVTNGFLSDIVLVREGLNCQSPTEAQYYSGKKSLDNLSHLNIISKRGIYVIVSFAATLATFPDICFYCGREEPSVQGPSIDELHEQYAVVRPICTQCEANGKQPKTSHPKLVKKRK